MKTGPRPSMIIESPLSTRVAFNGRDCLNFTGTNYLNLAGDPGVQLAAMNAITVFGVTTGASRATTGTCPAHLQLEGRLREFLGVERTFVCNSGSDANRIVMSALLSKGGTLVYDERAHPSIVNSVPRNAKLRPYKHNSVKSLSQILSGMYARELTMAVVAVNGVDPITGSIAPLRGIHRVVSRHSEVHLLVDDAHGFLVLGGEGRGTAEYHRIESSQIIQTGSFGKALGGYGGFIAGSEIACGAMTDQAAYIGTTALPPPIAAACYAALNLADNGLGRVRRRNLIILTRDLVGNLQGMGLNVAGHGAPILRIKGSHGLDIENLHARLLQKRIATTLVRYPTPASELSLRIALNAEHTYGEIKMLCDSIASII